MSTDKELRERFEKWYVHDFSDDMDEAPAWDESRNLYKDFPPHFAWKAYKAAHAEARAEIDALQCRIDNLMLEYCPEEMTSEQIYEWGKRQRVVSQEETGAIDAAMASEVKNNA